MDALEPERVRATPASTTTTTIPVDPGTTSTTARDDGG